MRDNAEWSRKLARAMSVNQPDVDTRKRLVKAYEKAESPSRLPKWVLDFIDQASTDTKNVSADLTKAGRDAVDRALAALKLIPMVDDRHIRSPWPVMERMNLDPNVWEESTIQAVNIAGLHASQHLLRKKTVKKYIKRTGNVNHKERSLGNVYDTNNRLVIVDGHHRLAALWLLGADIANVWFLEE